MADCAILAIASATQTVHALLQRLVKDVVRDEQPSVVPWTIVNKYYIAEVKFLVHPISSWDSIQHKRAAPALLFVWNKGESYRDQIRSLSQHASQHEFEVALAIRLPPTGPTVHVDFEDEQDVDAYLSAQGFEFVDVPDIEVVSPDRAGIPGIPRIIDALSTIMWPSMVRQTSKRVAKTGLIGATHSNGGISSDDYHNLVRLVGERISGNDGDRMQQELEELERWLDEDTLSSDVDVRSAYSEDDATPWSTAVTPGTLSPSLSAVGGFLEGSRPSTPRACFDDDFTSLVSASSADPAGVSRASSGRSPPPTFPPLASASFSSAFSFNSGGSTPVLDDQARFDPTRLAPGESYKTLGSASGLSDEEGDDTPTRAEIAETSRMIFGDVSLSVPPPQDHGDGSFQPLSLAGEAPSQGLPGEDADIEMMDADLERFDLQNVLGALQGLKEEIAGMPDKERRRAAARVALGLAYGLSGNPHSEELV